MISFSLLTPPAAEPMLLADAKQQARIDTTADDAQQAGSQLAQLALGQRIR